MKAIRNMEPAWEQERGRKFALTQLRVDIPNGGYRLRPVYILLDKMDEAHADFDEIIIERNLNIYWLHFAIRQSGNRRKVTMIVKR